MKNRYNYSNGSTAQTAPSSLLHASSTRQNSRLFKAPYPGIATLWP